MFRFIYAHRLRQFRLQYYGTGKYRRITGRAFTTLYCIVTAGVILVYGGICHVSRSETAVNGPVTHDVLIDLGVL